MNLMSDFEHHQRDADWDAAEDRRQAKQLRLLDHFLDRLNGTHKQHWFDKDETGYSDEQ